MRKFLKNKDGKFAGSIGDGKDNVPSSGGTFDRNLLIFALQNNDEKEVSLEELYDAYQAASQSAPYQRQQELELSADEAAEEAARLADARKNMLKDTIARQGWYEFPAGKESHDNIPVGTVMYLKDDGEQPARWIKVSPNLYSVIPSNYKSWNTYAQSAMNNRVGGEKIGPYPSGEGVWVAEAVIDRSSDVDEISEEDYRDSIVTCRKHGRQPLWGSDCKICFSEDISRWGSD